MVLLQILLKCISLEMLIRQLLTVDIINQW
nr:MAG TPA: hypothetical protein [Bacteriophage sp.]